MKVYNQQDIVKLLQDIANGDAKVLYAREENNNIVYCTFKVSRPLIDGLPRLLPDPSI
jgi:hypothetical protein